MAEGALKACVPENLKSSVSISSAGIHALRGMPATTEAELAAQLKGYDLSKHQSRPVSDVLLEEADLVLCMEAEQAAYLKGRFPICAPRIFTLKEYANGKGGDIPDPYGQDIFFYKEIMNQIDSEINRIKRKLFAQIRKQRKVS